MIISEIRQNYGLDHDNAIKTVHVNTDL